MLRFGPTAVEPDGKRRRRKIPNYLGRREQGKLLGLVMMLGLMIILTSQAGDPRRWAWLFAGQQNPKAAGEGGPDTRLKPAAEDPEGVFVARADVKAPEEGGREYFPGVDGALLRDVRDDTMFRPGDHKAFFQLLDVLRTTSEADLEKGSIGPVSYTQLFKQPNEYRGELVSVSDTIRRAHEIQAEKNEYGIEKYWQVWLHPDDRKSPLVVYCLDLPAAMPKGMKVEAPVKLTGFFFKRWAYLAADDINTVPLMLAKNVSWTPPPPPVPKPPLSERLLVPVGVALAFALAVVAFVVARTRREPPAVTLRPVDLHGLEKDLHP